MHLDADVKGLIARTLCAVAGTLMESSTRKLMQQDLTDVAEVAGRAGCGASRLSGLILLARRFH